MLPPHEVADTLLLALPVFLAQLPQVGVYSLPLAPALVLRIEACFASISARTSLTMAPASDVCISTSSEWPSTEGSSRAGCPNRTMGTRCGDSRSTMLSTEMLEGPHTRMRRFCLSIWRISSMRVWVLPVCVICQPRDKIDTQIQYTYVEDKRPGKSQIPRAARGSGRSP